MRDWRRFLGVFLFLFVGMASFHAIVWAVSGTIPAGRGIFEEATRSEAIVEGGIVSFIFALVATPLLLRQIR